jgi:hypothetical protein
MPTSGINFSNFKGGDLTMKRMLMAIMAVAVAFAFSAPSFAGEEGKKDKEKKGGHVVIYGEEKKDKDKDKKGK